MHCLAEHHHTRDTGTHKKLKPIAEVITTMMEHPSAIERWLAAEARKRIAKIDEESLITHASSLAKEHHVTSLSSKRKNYDDVADTMHDMTTFLKFFSSISSNTSHQEVKADLARQPYTLPASLLTNLRLDLVVHSPGHLHLLELTVCCQDNFLSAKLR